jgi:hypothetical protein
MIWFFSFFLFTQVQARVFNMGENTLSGYIGGSYAPSTVKKDFFIGESSATAYSKGFTQDIGAEFGLVYRTARLAWIFGFESLKPNKISGGTASTGGTPNYTYTSDLSVLAPKVGIELIMYEAPNQRVTLQGAVGTASLQTKTDYTNVTIAPTTDFTIEGKSTANMMSGAMASEWHWSDNTTVQLVVGYRDMNFNKIKLAEAATTSFQGALAKGSTLTKLDGTKVKYNFTGLYYAFNFRIWIF